MTYPLNCDPLHLVKLELNVVLAPRRLELLRWLDVVLHENTVASHLIGTASTESGLQALIRIFVQHPEVVHNWGFVTLLTRSNFAVLPRSEVVALDLRVEATSRALRLILPAPKAVRGLGIKVVFFFDFDALSYDAILDAGLHGEEEVYGVTGIFRYAVAVSQVNGSAHLLLNDLEGLSTHV